jgi:hypothetical protein
MDWQPIGERVLQNYEFLKRLTRTRSVAKRSKLLKDASCEELLAIVEIATNILKGKFCLKPRQKRKLIPFANYIRKTARLRSEKSARQYFSQTGGQAAIFGALLAPVLIEAAQYLISKVAGNDSEKINFTSD